MLGLHAVLLDDETLRSTDMRIIFVSRAKHPRQENILFDEKLIDRYETGTAFEGYKFALEHQESLDKEERAGITITVVGSII